MLIAILFAAAFYIGRIIEKKTRLHHHASLLYKNTHKFIANCEKILMNFFDVFGNLLNTDKNKRLVLVDGSMFNPITIEN